jgi:hypothetical protein
MPKIIIFISEYKIKMPRYSVRNSHTPVDLTDESHTADIKRHSRYSFYVLLWIALLLTIFVLYVLWYGLSVKVVV